MLIQIIFFKLALSVIILLFSFLFHSVKVPLIAHNLPFDQVFQFVRIGNHVLIVFDLHVSLDDAQIDSGKVDLPRVLLITMPDECEVCT